MDHSTSWEPHTFSYRLFMQQLAEVHTSTETTADAMKTEQETPFTLSKKTNVISDASDAKPREHRFGFAEKQKKAEKNNEKAEELVRKRKRGCVDIDEFMKMTPEERQKSVAVDVAAHACSAPEIPKTGDREVLQNVVSEMLKSKIFGCCNSSLCFVEKSSTGICDPHKHTADETFLGQIERLERALWSSDKSLSVVQRISKEKRKKEIHIPSYPFSESTNPAFTETALMAKDRGYAYSNRDIDAGLADNSTAPAFRMLCIFRTYHKEMLNIARTVAERRKAINNDTHRERQIIFNADSNPNSPALLALDDQYKRLQSVFEQNLFDMRTFTEAAVRSEIRNWISHYLNDTNFIVESALVEVLKKYAPGTDERELMGRLQRLLAGDVDNGDINQGTQDDDEQEEEEEDDQLPSEQTVYDVCASQFVTSEGCAACTPIAVLAAAKLAVAPKDRRRFDVADINTYIKTYIPWQGVVEAGIQWWENRLDADVRFQTAHEVLNTDNRQKRFFAGRFDIEEYGGRMYSEQPEGLPLPDFRTALQLCVKRADNKPFGCTVSFCNATLALACVGKRQPWYIFDSHGQCVPEHSVLVCCGTFDNAVDAVFYLFSVRRVDDRENEGAEDEDTGMISTLKGYSMTQFIATK